MTGVELLEKLEVLCLRNLISFIRVSGVIYLTLHTKIFELYLFNLDVLIGIFTRTTQLCRRLYR